jgi:23S rRNA pseudouridine2604 synthase
MRLNKYLSDVGYCSRREADRLIEAGRVSINGEPAALGTKVDETDEVRVDGKAVAVQSDKVYIAFHKPRGIECTTNLDVKDNIIDYIGYPERIYPVGRLDKSSEGLILLTNDGALSNLILKARHFHEKEYVVKVDKPISDAFLKGMREGVPLLELETVTRPCTVTTVNPYTFKIILTQGLNRQIRRMCEAFGYEVKRLQRIRVLNIELGDLPRGKWRHLTPSECEKLKRLTGKA